MEIQRERQRKEKEHEAVKMANDFISLALAFYY